MKKLICLLLTAVLLLTPAVMAETAAQWEFRYGDVNKDNALSAADALLVLQHAVNGRILDAQQLKAAEVSKNDTINAEDALWILQKAVNPLVTFPIQRSAWYDRVQAELDDYYAPFYE